MINMEIKDCMMVGIISGLSWLLTGYISGVEPIKAFQIGCIIGFCCFLAFMVLVISEKIEDLN